MTVSAVARLMPRPPARVDNRKQNAGDPTAATQHTTIINTSDLMEPVHVNVDRQVPSQFYSSTCSATVPLRLWGKLEETTRASSYHVTEHRPARSESLQPHIEPRQSTWLRPTLCGGWCLRTVLHAPSGACHKRRRRIFEDLPQKKKNLWGQTVYRLDVLCGCGTGLQDRCTQSTMSEHWGTQRSRHQT